MMFRWYSPFALPPSVVEELLAVGGIPWDPSEAPQQEGEIPLLLLYAAPHGVLSAAAAALEGYRGLLELAGAGHLCHVERLQGLLAAAWPDLAQGSVAPPPPEGGPPLGTPDPLRSRKHAHRR